jgi:hypothetical protein
MGEFVKSYARFNLTLSLMCHAEGEWVSWRGFLRCKKIMLAEKKKSISQLGRAVGVPYPLGRSLLMIWKTCQPVGVVVIYVGAVIHFFFFRGGDVAL